MSRLNVDQIYSRSGGNSAGPQGSLTGGMVRLGGVEWTTDTGYYDFNVVDVTKYINYKLYWYVSHQNSTNTGNQWNETALTFLVGDNEVTQYDNNVMWTASSNTTETINSTYAGSKSQIWIAGNGTEYDSHGECLISVPNNSNLRAAVRGSSQLIGSPRKGSTNVNYREDFSSVAFNQDPTLITGVRIRAWPGTGYTSQYGSVQLYGIEK